MPRVSASTLAGSWVVPASVVLVAAVSPFERSIPGSLFGLTVTTVELAVILALGVAAFTWWRNPRALDWRTPLTWPLAALVAAALAASLFAPEFRGAALRVTARLAVAALLFLLVVNVAATARIAWHIIAAMLAAAAIVGAIAVLELAQVPWVLDALKAFRPGFHVVGGQLRATSTLFYPTITSMFLEIAFALGLVWLASSRIAFVALVLTGAGVIATFTRAGLITMTISLLVYGALQYWRRRRWTNEHLRLVALAASLIALVLLSRSPQMLVARMSAEGSQEWYGASYDVPARLTLQPDSFNDVPITLKNQGRLTWQSSTVPPFALSYHWLTAATEEVVIFDGLRTPFAQPVAPGERVIVNARVRAPSYPGTYVLIWDVVQEHRTWLSLEGVYPGRSVASVDGPPVGAPLPTRGRMPSTVMRMPRSVLWATAVQIAREHPVTGIGPDNFRHTYGRYLGLAAWDTRVHANNTYIEVLAGMGAIGVIALLWLAVASLRSVPRLLAADPATLPLVAAASAACLAIAAHALVDSFLTFTPAYVAFAIATGLLFSTLRMSQPACA
jgi:O-Antigen ligase